MRFEQHRPRVLERRAPVERGNRNREHALQEVGYSIFPISGATASVERAALARSCRCVPPRSSPSSSMSAKNAADPTLPPETELTA